MLLLTEEIKKKLPKLYSQEHVQDPICVWKLFTPDAGWTFFIIEGEEQDDGDWLLFGKVVSPMCPKGEIGYISFNELKSVRGAYGLPVERDMYWDEKPLSQCK